MEQRHQSSASRGKLLAGLLAGLVAFPSLARADVAINVATKKQVIDGFGASSAWSGAMNDKIFDGLYKDLGFSILRLRIEEGIGDNWKTGNFSSWSAELSNSKKAKARGAIVFASPWNPPKSMQENFTKTGDASAQRLRYDKYQEYVDYLNAYVKYMKDNNAELYAISVQNEPDYAKDWNWWTPTEMLDFVKNYASKINSKVIAPESFQFLKNMSDPILNDATALENVDIIGFHLYGTSVNNFAYPLFESKGRPAGKKLWETEHFLGDDANITMSNVLTIAKEVHDCMVTGNHNAYVYWWIPHANGLTSTAGDLYKRAYSIGHFAKFVRPGYDRVDATATPASGVYVSAYSGDNKVAIVAINNGNAASTQKFTVTGFTPKDFTIHRTTESTNMVPGTSQSVSGNSFTVDLPAQSITSIVVTTINGSAQSLPKIPGFKVGAWSGSIHVSPAPNDESYRVVVRSVDGKQVAAKGGVTGALDIPVSGKGTYLVDIQSNGASHREMILVD